MFQSVQDQHRNSNNRVISNLRCRLMISGVSVLFSAPALIWSCGLTRQSELVCAEKSATSRLTATASSELADVYKKQGRYVEALDLYRSTLQIHETLDLDASDPELAIDHNNIGACLKNLGHRYARSRCNRTMQDNPIQL